MSVAGAIRAVATLATIPPCFAYGLTLYLFGRGRRAAVNRMFGRWVAVAGAVSGIRLDIEHAARIDRARPAVYIFNHRSAADIYIVCALLRRDFTAIAKHQLRRHPILGPPLHFCDAVFIDRLDRDKAIEALEPVAETLHRGVSIAIAPEGTRSAERPVGPFKKGAFRIAMAAGVPIVPLILHNADEIVPRGGLSLRPGLARCTVGAPIPTEGWTVDMLDERIAEVRRIYQEALAPA